MPEKNTIERARKDKARGKSASTQAGEFVREEMHHVREGKHGARSPQQAIAIGLSKARRAGVDLPPPRNGKAETKRAAASAIARRGRKTNPKRSRATRGALAREGQAAATTRALSRQGRTAAARRSASDRSAAAKRAARTKGPRVRSQAAKKAARTRKSHT